MGLTLREGGPGILSLTICLDLTARFESDLLIGLYSFCVEGLGGKLVGLVLQAVDLCDFL